MSVEAKVNKYVTDQFGKDVKPTLDTELADLNGDSLDIVELVMHIEDEFGIDVPEEHTSKWKTIGDIVSYVERRLKIKEDFIN